jgi:hypothetical protein
MPRHDVNDHATAETRRLGALAAANAKRERREEARRLLEETRREKLDEAVERLAGAANRAAEAIEQLLGAESESVKLRAALGVLEILSECEFREMLARVERLEQAANQNGRHA